MSEGLGQARQRPESARHADLFPACPQVESHPPAQPGSAGAESGVPSLASIEFTDQVEETGGGGTDVCRQLGDLVAQPVHRCEVIRAGGNDCREGLHDESPFCCDNSVPRLLEAPGSVQERRSRDEQ
jgi:hypothetical protein